MPNRILSLTDDEWFHVYKFAVRFDPEKHAGLQSKLKAAPTEDQAIERMTAVVLQRRYPDGEGWRKDSAVPYLQTQNDIRAALASLTETGRD